MAKVLGNWLDTQPEPCGLIVSGEAGFILQRDPDSGVGIDVAYVSAEVAARNPEGAYFEGPPVLAVESCRHRTCSRRLMRRSNCIWRRGLR